MDARQGRARGRADHRRRRGSVLLETAILLILVTSLVFGFFEYCRLLMDMNLLNNAAREAGRYVQVNNTSPTIAAEVQALVRTSLGSEAASFSSLTVTLSGTHDGTATPVNNLVPGDPITISVGGTYRFMGIVPLIRMPLTLNLSSSVTVGCEGGT